MAVSLIKNPKLPTPPTVDPSGTYAVFLKDDEDSVTATQHGIVTGRTANSMLAHSSMPHLLEFHRI